MQTVKFNLKKKAYNVNRIYPQKAVKIKGITSVVSNKGTFTSRGYTFEEVPDELDSKQLTDRKTGTRIIFSL